MNVHSRSGERMPGESPFGETQSLLRFVACGSVDHGKSTLLGRLLYESKQLFTDQLEALAADSRKYGTQGDELDYSLLLDGLAAEREQNITIDVAYRFFSTPRRKFIVIDTPGHEQYSANMATGASVADLALVLVSANEGVTRQTRRHIAIVGMLGIKDVVLVVNKMDRAGWREDTFHALEAEFREIAADLRHPQCRDHSGRSEDRRQYRRPFTTHALVSRRDVAPLSGTRRACAHRRGGPAAHAHSTGQPPRRAIPRL